MSVLTSGYGAPELKKFAHKNMFLALSVAAFIHLLLLSWISNYLREDNVPFVAINQAAPEFSLISLGATGGGGGGGGGEGGGRPTPPAEPAMPIIAEAEKIAQDVEVTPSEFISRDTTSIAGITGAGNGSGSETGSGTGAGSGMGSGVGSGIGPGIGPGIGGISVGPRLIREVFPLIPGRLKGEKVHGVAELKIKIDETGKVVDVEVLKNTTNSAEIAQAAVEAAFKCVYLPAMVGKKPITVWTTRILRIDYTE